MARFLSTVARLALTCVALASPLTSHSDKHQNGLSACAQVGASIAKQTAPTPTVPAQLAYDCIQSVPFNQSAALALVEGMFPYFWWQSNIKWVMDPPKEYVKKVQDPVDLMAGLRKIESKVMAGDYKNEFEFGMELYLLTQSSHDAHFMYVPDIVGSIFNFARPLPLVSVSSDGQELPKPYVYADVLAETLGKVSFTPSPISKIDGHHAKTFLENWSQHGGLQDRDALYNSVFQGLAGAALGPLGPTVGTFAGAKRGRWIFPGPTTELEFENGTTHTYDNYAKVLIPFDGITDGESLYRIRFTGNGTIPADDEPDPITPPSPVPAIPAPGYPPPVIREAYNSIGGYYLEDDMSDVAVLSVPTFATKGAAQDRFQATAVKFLAAAKAAGKKKLIIDVQANAGGVILLGYDLYKLLFPSLIDHAAADRVRAFESTNLIGQAVSNISSYYPRVYTTEEQNKTLYNAQSFMATFLDYRSILDAKSENFASWKDFYGPVPHKGDHFTNLFRWNLSESLLPSISGGIYIHGHGPLSNYTTTPFAAEDMVVVSDGYCGSTCAIFSELMRQRAGVKYISIGGRSRAGMTQAVGGTKGSNVWPWSVVKTVARFAYGYLLNSENTELTYYWSDVPFHRATYIQDDVHPVLNLRDAIRDGDETNTPLHFVYEPADCRMLYTKAMTVDITTVWKAVAETTWGNKNHCIAGSVRGKSAKGLKKRALTEEDLELSRKTKEWRANLKVEDYQQFSSPSSPESKGGSVFRDGMMYP